MQIKIVFYKNSSKYYDSCCLRCEKFDMYKCEKNKNTLIIFDEEIRLKRLIICDVLKIVNNWKKTEFYIDDVNVSVLEVEKIINLLSCEKAKIDELVGDHCYALNGWGCNHLEQISFSDNKFLYHSECKYYWYQFGYFKDNSWVIDKEKIKKTLKSEIDKKYLNFCKCFDIKRIYATVEKLPDIVKVDENNNECRWQYVYKDAPAGMSKTEIIGVEPKKEEQQYCKGVSISFDEIKKIMRLIRIFHL